MSKSRAKWTGLAGAVLAGCAWLAAPVTAQAQDQAAIEDLYKGYSGEDFVFNGAAYSGTLKDGVMDTALAHFAKKTGVKVLFDAFCCGIAKLQAAQESGNVPWTIVSFATMTDLRLAEKNNLLLKLDPAVIPLDKVRDDGHDEYAVYAYPYAAVVAWNTDKWPLSARHPKGVEDVFDTASFPGKRCLYKYPQFGGTMEAALLAAGVAPDKLYPMDTKKAFDSLNKIRDDIVWWNSGSQGVQQLVSGACDIALVWNGPISESIRSNGGPFAIAWRHAIWDYTPVSIPKGVKNEKAAKAFLRLMIEDRKAQEDFVKQTSYVMLQMKDPVKIPDDVKPWALAGDNLKMSIREDDKYYTENIDALLKQFNGWVVSGSAQ